MGNSKRVPPNQRIDHNQPDQFWSCEMAIPFSDYIATTNTPQKKGRQMETKSFIVSSGGKP
ncbi:hypothetical protein CMK22_03245 [Candidatus Poribacteria bacterium]|nr:hypothetical protein [Candidatus Poribacteria bacterium]